MERVLLLVLATSIAAAVNVINEPLFRPGVEYVYSYESQVLSGIRTVSRQLAGVKIHATVKLQIHREGLAALKLDHIRVFQINHEIPHFEAYNILGDERLTLLTGDVHELLKKQLNKPIKFRYVDGEVREIEPSRDDKYWSINIKKGLLSSLQLKLNARSIDLELLEKPKVRFLDTVRSESSSRVENAFNVLETDVNGDCETKYTIVSDRSRDFSAVSDKVVTKVKNLENCLNKQTYEQGLFGGLPHLPSESNLIDPSSEAEYVISGDRHHFLIKKMKLHAKYLFRPYSQEGGHISSHVIQLLTLRSTEEIRTSLLAGVFMPEKMSLKMEIPEASLLTESSVDELRGEGQYKDLIERKLSELVEMIYPKLKDESSAKLMQLSLILKEVPQRQLLSIVKSYINVGRSGVESKKREILLDLLPVLIRPHIAKVLSELILDGSLHGVRATLSINAMSLTIKPTPEVVKTLLSLYKELDRTSTRDLPPHIRRTVLLSVGAVSNKMINLMKKSGKPIREVLETIDHVGSELEKMLLESRDESEKIRVLKAMGNMGAKNLFTPLKAVIEDKSLSKLVRMKAIGAMRKLSKPFERMVHPLMLSIFMNKKENSEVRLAAYTILRKGLPSFTTMQMIAHTIRDEPSHQVKTFVYSSLVSTATLKTNIRELEETVKIARKVLKMIRPVPINPLDSKSLTLSFFSENLNIGGIANVRTIKSKYSNLPEKVVGSLQKSIFGNSLKLVETGIEGSGLEAVLRRLLGPYGILKDLIQNKASIYDLLKPLSSPEMLRSVKDQMNDIFQKKSFDSYGEHIRALLFLEILGQELQYIELTPENIERVVKLVIERLPELLEKLSNGINVDVLKTISMVTNSLTLPTPIGVPLSLNVSFAGILKVKGTLKGRNLPTLAELLRGSIPRRLELESSIMPSVNTEVFGYMGVDMRWLRAGVAIVGKLNGEVPVVLKLALERQDMKLSLKTEIPKDLVKYIHVELTPVTFVFRVPKTLEDLPFKYSMKELNTKEIVKTITFEKVKFLEFLGVKLIVKGSVKKCAATWCPMCPLTGKQSITLKLIATKEVKEELYIQVKNFGKDDEFGKLKFDEDDEDDDDRRVEVDRRKWEDIRSDSLELRDSSEFDPVEPDPTFTNPRKMQFHFEVGSKRGRHMKTQLTWIHGARLLQQQLNAQTICLSGEQAPSFKGNWNFVLRLPPHYEIASSMLNIPFSKTLVKMTLKWKVIQHSQKTIIVKLSELDFNTWRSELIKGGYEYMDNLPVTPSIYRYALGIEFSEITPKMKKYLMVLTTLLKNRNLWHLKIDIPETPVPNKVLLLTQIVPKWEKVSLIVKTPFEIDYLIGVPIRNPLLGMYFRPSLTDEYPINFYKNYTNNLENDDDELNGDDNYNGYEWRDPSGDSELLPKYRPTLIGKCKVHSDRLTTFDGMPLLLPERPTGSCHVVLAHDCSERKLFSIGGTLVDGKWIVKVLIPEYHISLHPDRSVSSEYTVKVNGNDITRPRRSSPVLLYSDDRSKLLVTIKKTSEGLKVELHELKLTLELKDGEKITLKLSPFSLLQGRVCGLCGDYNYDQSDELVDFNNRPLYTHLQYVLDKVLPSETCDVRDYERELGVRYDTGCRKEVTLKVNRIVNNVEQVCFSKSPVTVCKKGCSKEDVLDRIVRFTCLTYDDPKLEVLTEKLLEVKILTEVENMPVDYEESMEMPSKCTCDH